MQTIARKSMLYKSKVEYADYTMNHVQGCAHGCNYPCYAFLMAKRFGKASSYNEWICPKLVSNTLELLDREIPRLKDKIERVQLCFTTDPFMHGFDEVCEMSVRAIEKLSKAGVPCVALTKGLLPEELAGISSSNVYGITLVSLDEQYRCVAEPGAAPYSERIAALKHLHDLGEKTWVSMEPYPTPNIVEQELGDILREIPFVDRIIFGRTNYSKRVSSYAGAREFYDECAREVIRFCEEHGIDYWIKKGTMLDGQARMAA